MSVQPDKRKEDKDSVDFKYTGSPPMQDRWSYKYIMLTVYRWAPTDGSCASFVALGLFALLVIATCSIVANSYMR